MKTGFDQLDEMIDLDGGNVIVIGARTAMGKSVLSRQIYQQLAADKTVDAYDYERPRRDSVFANVRIFSKEPGLTFEDVVDEYLDGSRKVPDVIVLDCIQLVATDVDSNEQTARIAKKLKMVAVENDVLVIIISQLTRAVEGRVGHRPMLQDLRGTGSLEEIADVVLFILRRDYYDPLDKPGTAEIIIGKNKNGKIGSVNLLFDKEKAKFTQAQPNNLLDHDDQNSPFAEFMP